MAARFYGAGLEEVSGLHLEVAVDDVDSEAGGRCEQRVDAVAAQFGYYGTFEAELAHRYHAGIVASQVARTLGNVVRRFHVIKEDNQQTMTHVHAAQVGELSPHTVERSEIGVEHEQAAAAYQAVDVDG